MPGRFGESNFTGVTAWLGKFFLNFNKRVRTFLLGNFQCFIFFCMFEFFPFYIVVDHRLRFCVTLFRMIWGVLFLSTLKHFHIYVHPPTSRIIDSLPSGLKGRSENSKAEWRWVDLSSEWQPEKAPRHLKLFLPESSKTLSGVYF